MASTLGPRRLRTETWGLGTEVRFLSLVGAANDEFLVPKDGRAYVALGFVLFEAYAELVPSKAREGQWSWPVRWRLVYVGRQTRNLP